MQLTTVLHVLALKGHHQAYKIMVLTKAHAVILPTGIPWFTDSMYIKIQYVIKILMYIETVNHGIP